MMMKIEEEKRTKPFFSKLKIIFFEKKTNTLSILIALDLEEIRNEKIEIISFIDQMIMIISLDSFCHRSLLGTIYFKEVMSRREMRTKTQRSNKYGMKRIIKNLL